MLSLEGKQLGNYDVIQSIRVGGMGAVYEGRQRTAFGRRVAIKVIHNDYASDRDMRRRFAREARTIARLQHPHILPLIEFGDERGILYLVMPLIEGGTLTTYLRHNLPDLAEVTAIYRQLLDAVEYAHEEGLIHRDIKSSNVLLEMRRNGPPHVYLADFGLVRVIRPNGNASTEQIGKPIPLDQVPGTPHYMAPEQTRGVVTPLTDIYALGVLLYQLLTGLLPYNHSDEIRVIQMHLSAPIPSPCDHDASIPYELDEVVRTAMAKDPDDRYQSVGELRAAFLAALRGPGRYEVETEARDKRQHHRTSSPRYRRQVRQSRDEKLALPLPPQQASATPPTPEPIILQRKPTQEPTGRTRESLGETAGLSLRQPLENTTEIRERPEITHRLERADRVHTTDSIRENYGERGDHNRPRNTEEPGLTAGQGHAQSPRQAIPLTQVGTIGEELAPLPTPIPKNAKTNKTKRPHPLILALIAVTVLTILLLVVSNALGMKIIPQVGGSRATVQITETPTQLQESYVLTAAPQYTTPAPNKFAIPARVLQSTSTDGNKTATTGQKNVNATAAHGILLFTNAGDIPIFINAGQDFFTGAGIHIKLTQDIEIPGRQNAQDGTIKVSVTTANSGKASNIAANTPLQANPDLPPQITVQIPNAFSGGNDAQVVHTVAQADIDAQLIDLRKKLTQQADQQLQNQLASGEIMATKPTYSETVTSNFPVGAQTDQVQVTLSVQESVIVYKPSVAVQVAGTLLDNKANHSLGANFKRTGDITRVGDPNVSDVNKDTIHLSVTVHGSWIYNFSPTQVDQWRRAIQGLTPAAAQTYLKAQKYVSDVHVELPFGADHLPSTASDIQIEFM
jgi:serine/threonine protein kinase